MVIYLKYRVHSRPFSSVFELLPMIAEKEAEMTVMSFKRLYGLLTNMSRCQAFLGNSGFQ